MSPSKLRIPPGAGPNPTAAQHNGVLALLLANRLLGTVARPGSVAPFIHPWRVTAERLGDRTSLGATLPAATVRIDVAPGTILDQLATIPYRRAGDPRGWIIPADYVAAVPSAPDYDATWIERDVLDDPDDPPFLAARDPADFEQIADEDRPTTEQGAFCSAADWKKELWRTHVILSAATPRGVSPAPAGVPLPALKRFRIYVAKEAPALNFGAIDGGALELATVYLLRDPASPDSSELQVRQREWYALWTAIIQPTSSVAIPILGQEVQAEVDNILANAVAVEFWNV